MSETPDAVEQMSAKASGWLTDPDGTRRALEDPRTKRQLLELLGLASTQIEAQARFLSEEESARIAAEQRAKKAEQEIERLRVLIRADHTWKASQGGGRCICEICAAYEEAKGDG